jgi:hypothetical protein
VAGQGDVGQRIAFVTDNAGTIIDFLCSTSARSDSGRNGSTSVVGGELSTVVATL